MAEEVKRLLNAFDVPYITAPFEAEAQCAYLEQVCLYATLPESC
jgi:5'-3' exonuclease